MVRICRGVAAGAFARPNVGGNRHAALSRAEDRGVCRRVRLTVRLGHAELDCAKSVRTRVTLRNAEQDECKRHNGKPAEDATKPVAEPRNHASTKRHDVFAQGRDLPK